MIRKDSLRAIAGLCLLSLVLTSCATKPQPTTTTKPSATPATPVVAEKDKVLWQYRNGLAALRKGNYAAAKSDFDAAIARIGNILGNDESARKARGYFKSESTKTFI